ncbi:hypothetical protein X559_1605 [Paenilisteria newyorkensis]|nr:hypothetical protein X559_1605 [Listeria newyorkensis]
MNKWGYRLVLIDTLYPEDSTVIISQHIAEQAEQAQAE